MDKIDEILEEEREKKLRNVLEERERKFSQFSHFSYYAYVILIVSVILLFAFGYIPRFLMAQKIDALANQTIVRKVSIIVAKPNEQPIPLVLPSSLDAINITPLWARVDGYIKVFLHDIGDEVKEGDILAVIETPELDQQYEQSIADLDTAKANLAIAKITAERWNALYQEDPESISKQEVDQRNADLAARETEVSSAQANMDRILKTLAFKLITAPFDGIIIERDIDIGTLITAGSAAQHQQLFKIAKTNIMRVFVDVPQRFFRQIKDDVQADVIISEFQGKVFKGFVARYAKALDPVARTLLTEVHILNPANELLVGLYAEVKFLFKPEPNSFFLPTTAVIIDGGNPKVAVLDDNDIVHMNEVTLGIDHGKIMEITSGIKENDKIVTNPSARLQDGEKVEIVKTIPPIVIK